MNNIMDTITIHNINSHTIASLAIIYANFIQLDTPEDEIMDANEIILTKYKPSGLLRIKEKAWKMIKQADP